MVDPSQAETMADTISAAGMTVEEVMITGVGHGWVQPGDPAATIRGSQEVMAVTFDFLRRVLTGSPLDK